MGEDESKNEEETEPGREAIGPDFSRWEEDWGDMTVREISRAIHGERKQEKPNMEEIRELLMDDLGIDAPAAEKIMAEAPIGEITPGTREHEVFLREYAYEVIERTKYPERELPDHPIFEMLETDGPFLNEYNTIVNRIMAYLVWRFDTMGETLFVRHLGFPRYEFEAARKMLEDEVELAMNAMVQSVATESQRVIVIRFENPVIARLQCESERFEEESQKHYKEHFLSKKEKK
jgi:hypothetical protein